jgi:hypothetical protein
MEAKNTNAYNIKYLRKSVVKKEGIYNRFIE